jgi:hypothetical protein
MVLMEAPERARVTADPDVVIGPRSSKLLFGERPHGA